MERKEWRRLAAQSVFFFFAVLACCVHFSVRRQEQEGKTVSAKKAAQAENTEGKPGRKKETAAAKALGKGQLIGKTVVIDAGHGGIDEGTTSQDGKYLEKDFTLVIAKRLKKLLEARKAKVYFTRTEDRYVSKKKRIAFANRKKADLLVSIHCNASTVGDVTADGIETLYSMKKTGNAFLGNKKLAQIMLKELAGETGLRRRGIIKRRKLYLLRFAKMPAVIVEIGYMSNRADLNFMRKKSGQQKIAQGICNGIIRALEE